MKGAYLILIILQPTTEFMIIESEGLFQFMYVRAIRSGNLGIIHSMNVLHSTFQEMKKEFLRLYQYCRSERKAMLRDFILNCFMENGWMLSKYKWAMAERIGAFLISYFPPGAVSLNH